MIERSFQEIHSDNLDKDMSMEMLLHPEYGRSLKWNDLLQSQRILIVSEAGSGKTHECRAQAEKLSQAGEAAFFVALESLAASSLRECLNPEEEERLDTWLGAQSEVASFFLDSVDELRLTPNSFEAALRKFRKEIKDRLHRARIVITTRPIPFDKNLVEKLLPLPAMQTLQEVSSPIVQSEEFARIAMRKNQVDKSTKPGPPQWREVNLLPFSEAQILEFAREQGVADPNQLLQDLKRRHAEEFATRPQDLIELCADWRVHKRIRSHREQVDNNIRIKLQAREDRKEAVELSVERAFEGASRLALALQLTRRLTIRHNAKADDKHGEAALDPASILTDWTVKERITLLERALFGFASYGRVRFHHRSVLEFLAAQRLLELRKKNLSLSALKRLLFAQTHGKTIVRPSKRALAGWLALEEESIFKLLLQHEPAVLLDEADPASLNPSQRMQALRAFCTKYGAGGWRGLRVPSIQIQRFASEDLAETILEVWQAGIENYEITEILLNIIEEGRIAACADLAYTCACDGSTSELTKIYALDALVALEDKRLKEIASEMTIADSRWTERVVLGTLNRLFPKYITVERFCEILRRVKLNHEGLEDLTWLLQNLVEKPDLDLTARERLRDEFTAIIVDDLQWQKNSWPHLISPRTQFCGALAILCEQGLCIACNDNWLRASVIALRTASPNHSNDEPFKLLQARLANLNAETNARLFWIVDAFLQSYHEEKRPWYRIYDITRWHTDDQFSDFQLIPERDLPWIRQALSDTSRDADERSLLLEMVKLSALPANLSKDALESVKLLIEDNATLLQAFNDWLRPVAKSAELIQMEKESEDRQKKAEQKTKDAYASWVQFWHEISNQPEQAFSDEKQFDTCWNLWQAMFVDQHNRRSSDWNRHLIERQFSKQITDIFRLALMRIWRQDHPTLPSERAEGERNTYLTRWLLGLSGIYAEAEDPDWARKISGDEAQLAARYALLELNDFPLWLNGLASTHPLAVADVIGKELAWELKRTEDYSSTLQKIHHSSPKLATLLSLHLIDWLAKYEIQTLNQAQMTQVATKIRRSSAIIAQHADGATKAKLIVICKQRLAQPTPSEIRNAWLLALLHLEPDQCIAAIESEFAQIEPGPYSAAVICLAQLFGDFGKSVNISQESFTPPMLLRLAKLAYRHVREEDDISHEGTYSPGPRDNAQDARRTILQAILDAKGESAWRVKLEMAGDPLFASFKDRIRAVADENWALEIDADVCDENAVREFEMKSEIPPMTNEAMFSILMDRLADINQLLLLDASPRSAWANIDQESNMRNAIVEKLDHLSNGIYSVHMEGITADGKETDIRLQATGASYQAVIELKLADGRTAKDLLDTIEQQLVKKYLAPETRKAGVLVFTLAKDRNWDHPETKQKIGVEELIALLQAEAERVQEALAGEVLVGVHFLDLRPRLPTEATAKKKKTKP